MARLNLKNNAETELTSSVNATATTFLVASGAALPTVPFMLSIKDEIVEVTAKSGNNLTVTRAMENTVAGSYGVGDVLENRFTSGAYDTIVTRDETGEIDNLATTEKSTLVGAINETFTKVSDGKNLIGGAITDVDDTVVIPTEPSFQDLADGISGISSGKKWASGTVNVVGDDDGSIVVTGLSFKPRIVNVEHETKTRFIYTNFDYGSFYIISDGINNPNATSVGYSTSRTNSKFEILYITQASGKMNWTAYE